MQDTRSRAEKNRRVPPHERAAARSAGAAPAADDVAEATRLAQAADKARERQEGEDFRRAAAARECSSCGARLEAGKLRPADEVIDDEECPAAMERSAPAERTLLDDLAD